MAGPVGKEKCELGLQKQTWCLESMFSALLRGLWQDLRCLLPRALAASGPQQLHRDRPFWSGHILASASAESELARLV